MIRPVYWAGDSVVMIDQKALPHEERYLTFQDYRDVANAIRDMTVRGAPAIGIAAAMGIALGIGRSPASTPGALADEFQRICTEFATTRPTAYNLFWAIDRMTDRFRRLCEDNAGIDDVRRALRDKAVAIAADDIERNRRMGAFGNTLFPHGGGILTHCNAGALATGGYGTALGVIRALHEAGKPVHVYVDETRPVLQGARLTAWEMKKEGIPATLIADTAAGACMKQGKIDGVIVGADRIAANGDTANKIGTYSLAVLAHAHGIPLYVAAPFSTIDFTTKEGADIPIEERSAEEVLSVGGVRTAPDGIDVYNPAFDVTPCHLIDAIITERGIVTAPYDQGLKTYSTDEE